MIIKQHELRKLNTDKFNIYLFYGKNDGLKNEIINQLFLKDFNGDIKRYDENYFITNREILISEMLNKSLFENSKIVIISRVTDKILNFIDEVLKHKISDIKILLKSGILEKRSKLRVFFEKDKELITIPFYEDNESSLNSLILEFTKKNNINLSRESINLLIRRASGERENLKNELKKLMYYSISNKKIELSTVEKLSNLAENFSVNLLADNYLCKNNSNIARILNENLFSDEDCILILRTILNKSKRLLTIIKNYEVSKNLDEVILNTKPPIFWKDKDIIKKQVNSWKIDDLKNKIYQINEIETFIKSNSRNSLNLISDFIFNY